MCDHEFLRFCCVFVEKHFRLVTLQGKHVNRNNRIYPIGKENCICIFTHYIAASVKFAQVIFKTGVWGSIPGLDTFSRLKILNLYYTQSKVIVLKFSPNYLESYLVKLFLNWCYTIFIFRLNKFFKNLVSYRKIVYCSVLWNLSKFVLRFLNHRVWSL